MTSVTRVQDVYCMDECAGNPDFCGNVPDPAAAKILVNLVSNLYADEDNAGGGEDYGEVGLILSLPTCKGVSKALPLSGQSKLPCRSLIFPVAFLQMPAPMPGWHQTQLAS